jgi:chromosomal replication initiation ATPase DnaA
VFRLLNERKDKPTIITSNLSPENIAELHDERIASRLRAGTVIEVTADDRRQGRRLRV